MAKKQEKNKWISPVLVFVLILVILSLVVGISFLWHSAPIKNTQFALSLESYDNKINDSNLCFVLGFSSEGLKEKNDDLLVSVNGKIALHEKLVVVNEDKKEICLAGAFFNNGANFVEASILSRSVFFNVEKGNFEKQPSDIRMLSLERVSETKAELKFDIQNDDMKKEPVMIFVNNNLIRKAFYETGQHTELIEIVPSENNVKLQFGLKSNISILNNSVTPKSNLIVGLFIMAFLLFVLITTVFSKKELIENILFSILSFFVILIIVFFILNLFGFLSSITLTVLMAAIAIVLLLLFIKNFKVPEMNFELPNQFVVFLVLFLLVVLFFNVITPTNVSFWTSFYERQSETMFELNGVPHNDLLTHFGEKEYGYMSAYFFIDAGLAMLFGDFSQVQFAVIMFLANIALFISAFIFFKKIGMSQNKSLLGLMLLLIGGFLIGDVFFNERHIIALAMLFTSFAMFVENKRFAFILSGIAMWVQLPVFIPLVLVSFILIRKKFKSLLKFWAGAAIIGVLFYIPVFLIYGLPTQAKPTTWGYLFGMPWYGVLVDLLAQIIFIFLIMLPLSNFRPKLNIFAKKVLVLLVALIAIQAFISYRVNIATTIVASFIGVYLFPPKLLAKKEVRHLLFIIFVGGALVTSMVLLNYVVPDFAISAANHLELTTSSESRILNEPALGHYTAYFANRLIMSDLAVEYANAQMIDDSFYFFENGSRGIIEKYNINYVFNRKYYLETQPVGSVEREEPIEFTFLDKVYDNGTFVIHKVN